MCAVKDGLVATWVRRSEGGEGESGGASKRALDGRPGSYTKKRVSGRLVSARRVVNPFRKRIMPIRITARSK